MSQCVQKEMVMIWTGDSSGNGEKWIDWDILFELEAIDLADGLEMEGKGSKGKGKLRGWWCFIV